MTSQRVDHLPRLSASFYLASFLCRFYAAGKETRPILVHVIDVPRVLFECY
jgi:hypothetical protein